MEKCFDIIIVGGGISGSLAGISAARNGADVLVVEQEGYLGGMLTAAGVGPMMSFHAGDVQIIKGLADELITRLYSKGKSTGHIFDTTGYVPTVTPFDAEAMKRELETMLLESGGTVLYHTMLADVQTQDSKIVGITVCNKQGLVNFQAKVFIDATGDADLSAWAGVACVKGRASDGLCQPMTLNMKFTNVAIDKVKAFVKENPEQFSRINNHIEIIDKSSRLSIGGFEGLFKDAVDEGRITFKRSTDVLFFETNNEGEVIVNTTRVINCDPTNPVDLTKAEIEGRRQASELEQFFINCVPGFEHASFVVSGPRIGVRSSRQIIGLYTLTKNDIIECKKFEDRIAYCAYPVDVHPPEGIAPAKTENEYIPRGFSFTIPYRSLINSSIDNLITVGRCISATYEAQGAIRTTPTVGAIGQAGGAAASIAVKLEIPVSKVPIEKLHDLLISQGAYMNDNPAQKDLGVRRCY